LQVFIYSGINRVQRRHSRESGNPEQRWIPGQARNDKLYRTYVVMYNSAFRIPHSAFLFYTLKYGSKASLSQSPKILKEITVMRMATPGMEVIHQAVER